jgi:hypothetical protein
MCGDIGDFYIVTIKKIKVRVRGKVDIYGDNRKITDYTDITDRDDDGESCDRHRAPRGREGGRPRGGTEPVKAKPMKASDENTPETIDGETGLPDPTPRAIKLSSLRDVRLELAHVYRKMDAGELEGAEGTKRAYVLRQIHDVIVSAELERRIQELEDRQGSGGMPALSHHRSFN